MNQNVDYVLMQCIHEFISHWCEEPNYM